MRAGFLRFLALFLLLSACRPHPSSPSADPSVVRLSPMVERIRQLKFETPVRVGHKSTRRIRDYVNGKIREDYGPSDIEHERDVLVLLGLLPEKFSYREKILTLFSEQIAAYYDPPTDTLFLSDHLSAGSLDDVIVHELTHGLQQQHFGIGKLMDRKDQDDDRKLALNALVEGEALCVMLEFEFAGKALSEKSREDLLEAAEAQMRAPKRTDRQLAGIPRFMQEELLFPYVEGLNFIAALRKSGGWERVDEAYRRLPASTEQILHPKRYLESTDQPVEVPSTIVGEGGEIRKVLTDNVMGEFGSRLILETHLLRTEALLSSEGWGGDRYWLVERRDGKKALVWATVWDKGPDAERFERSLIRVRFPRHAIVIREGQQVLLTLGLEETTARALMVRFHSN
ncbi:MAG: hypothetical protein V1798_04205 [Pseudomonadota bacterium]